MKLIKFIAILIITTFIFAQRYEGMQGGYVRGIVIDSITELPKPHANISIVKSDFKHLIKGDILKAAGFNAPTLNRARGNIFALDNLNVRWTGANYLK